jgi:hypothetical protein
MVVQMTLPKEAAILSAATALLMTFFCPVAALGAVIDRAASPTIGCSLRQDLLDVVHAGGVFHGITGSSPKAAAEIRRKIETDKCFFISLGQSAVTDQRWQAPADLWTNVAVFSTRSGRKFYSTLVNWTYVGEVFDFVQ